MDLIIKVRAGSCCAYPFSSKFNNTFRKLQFKLPSGRVLYQVDALDFGEILLVLFLLIVWTVRRII